jgi:hypothetical protein
MKPVISNHWTENPIVHISFVFVCFRGRKSEIKLHSFIDFFLRVESFFIDERNITNYRNQPTLIVYHIFFCYIFLRALWVNYFSTADI